MWSGPSTLTLVQALLLWFKYQDDPVLKCAEEREVTSAEERGVTGAEERGVTGATCDVSTGTIVLVPQVVHTLLMGWVGSNYKK